MAKKINNRKINNRKSNNISADTSIKEVERTKRVRAVVTGKVLTTFFKYLFLGISAVLIVYFVAGKHTKIDFSNFTIEVNKPIFIALCISLVVNIWLVVINRAQRRIKEQHVKFYSDRVKSLETRLDSNRSSSNLPKTGGTRDGD